jgi:phage shock protein PspC (stress-responsive transcriptional regulator)
VCAAVARRLGIEPKVVRIIAVVSAIALGGLGAALYLAGVLLLPRDSEQLSPLERALPFTRTWPRWVVVFAVVGILVALTWGSGAGPVMIPVGIIGLVVWGATRNRGRVGTAVAEPTPFERAADAWRVRLAEQQVPGFELPAEQPRWQQPYTDPSDNLVSDSPALPPAVPLRRRRSWRLWGLALALVGTFSLAVAVLSTTLGLPGTPVAYASAVLAGLGATAVVATRSGRPPLLIPATVIAALVLGGLLVSPQVPTHGRVGDFKARYTSVDQMPPSIDVALGDADVDLSGLSLTGSRTLDINVRAGDVMLRLPTTAMTEVDWNVSAGDVTLNGLNQGQTGIGSSGEMASGSSTGEGVVTVHVNVALGDLKVVQ